MARHSLETRELGDAEIKRSDDNVRQDTKAEVLEQEQFLKLVWSHEDECEIHTDLRIGSLGKKHQSA